ncbi:MAG: hypothetical protein KJP00_13000 [Bacteroidia bacterium]|nr:hypothetical protein [Bacteroidia bacterium]
MKENNRKAIILQEVSDCVDRVIEKVGKEIRLGVPLGAGKPNQFINEIYQRAKDDPSINLTILSALTLERPKGKSLLEKRFFDPFSDRVFGDYPDMLFELDRTENRLPPNVRVIEFYFPAGKFNNHEYAQRNYISSNYTHVARDLVDRGVNVLAQIVAKSDDLSRLSLSCNPDVSMDMVEVLNDKEVALVAQINTNLPYMYGDADIPTDTFHYVIDNPDYNFKIFGPPKMSVPDPDYMIGLYASTLVKDGGELQVGIGSLGDALTYGLVLKHKNNKKYRTIIEEFGQHKFDDIINAKGSLDGFDEGLFGASEMFVDSFMFLIQEGIMKRKAYDSITLQRLINEGKLKDEKVTPELLYYLLRKGAIEPILSQKDFRYLQKFGVLKEDLKYRNEQIFFSDGTHVEADLNNDFAHEQIVEKGLGTKLKNGAIIHGGFFLGPAKFYEWLKSLPEEERRLIHMKSVRSINQLYGHEPLDRLHRKDGRFFNTCLMMTLMGAAVSDGLEDGTVISGVGGQYNFVDMAHALPDGHSVLQLRSTRTKGGKTLSNIVWKYGHITIPRHLRDIVITEYGIADIRGKTDEEVIIELIQIADSKFQDELVQVAKQAGKLSKDYQVPEAFRNNYPDQITQKIAPFKKEGLFPVFPFGTDFTHEEQVIGKALKSLKEKTSKTSSKLSMIIKALLTFKVPESTMPYLKRMQLDQPQNFEERLYQKILANEIK